jgi:hypothetical protein
VRLKHLLLGCTVALVGCDTTDVTDPNLLASGSVSFSYTGAGSASATSYSAVGSPPLNMTSFGTTPWSVGSTQAAGQVIVMGVAPKTSTTWDIAFITIARTTVGSSTIDPLCTANACTEVFLTTGANANETSWAFDCVLSSGSVVITSITSTRVAGTFSGSGTCVAGTSTTTSAFTVTGGTFDVALSTATFP